MTTDQTEAKAAENPVTFRTPGGLLIKLWAERTIARYEAGEYVNPATLAMARDVLEGTT